MIILVILVYIIIALTQCSILIKRNYRKELIIFFAFWVPALILTILYFLNVNIPSPAKFIQYIVEDILQLKYPE